MSFSKNDETLDGSETIVDLVVDGGNVRRCYLKNIAEEVKNLPKEYNDCYECSGTFEEAEGRGCRRFGIFNDVEPMVYGERMKVLGL